MKNLARKKDFRNLALTKKLFLLLLFLITGSFSYGQNKGTTISGLVNDGILKTPISYATIQLKTKSESNNIAGSLSGEDGRFSLPNVQSGNYILEISIIGYITKEYPFYVGSLSEFLDLNIIELVPDSKMLEEVVITSERVQTINDKMDKKTFSLADNIAQAGGSVLQSMQNLPGITVQDGKVQLRGNDKVMILIDGKQTALTGFGNQSGLDNIAASAIEKIEIINNPSAKFDANGNAGIINII